MKRALLVALLLSPSVFAQELAVEDFDRLHDVIRPQKGEIGWESLSWETNVSEARKKAAERGMPLFVWRANDGHVLGMT